MVALTDASPTQLGSVVRVLSPAPPWAGLEEHPLAVCLRADELVALAPESRVLLRVRAEDLEWINLNRPIFADRALRAILWADAVALDGLVRVATDTFDWVSQMIPVPSRSLPVFVTEGMRAALTAGVEFSWDGPPSSINEALKIIEWSGATLEADSSTTYHVLLQRLREPGLPIIRGITTERDAWRVRMAIAQSGRRGSWVALHPAMELPGVRKLTVRQDNWDTAAARLTEAGWRNGALAAAWFDLEPERIQSAIARSEGPTQGRFSPESLARGTAPAWVLRAPEVQAVLVQALDDLQSGDAPHDPAGVVSWAAGSGPWMDESEGPVEARLVRGLRMLGPGIPPEVLSGLAERVGYMDVAMEALWQRYLCGAEVPMGRLVEWLRSTGEIVEAQRMAQDWLVQAQSDQDVYSLCEANIGVGDVAYGQGDYKRARQAYGNALAAVRTTGELPVSAVLQRVEAIALTHLGSLELRVNDLSEARRLFLRALEIFRLVDDRRGVADTLLRMGDLMLRSDAVGEARGYYKSALAGYRETRHVPGEASVLVALGYLSARVDELTEAEGLLHQALALYRYLGHRQGEANTVLGLAALEYRRGDLSAARSNFERALAHYREIADRQGEANTLQNLADLKVSVGDVAGARADYGSALVISETLGDKLGATGILHGLGELELRLGDFEAARSAFERSLRVSAEIGSRLGVANNLRGLATLKLSMGDPSGARVELEQSLPIYVEIHDRLGEAHSLLMLGEIERDARNFDRARERYEQAMRLFREFGDRGEVAARQGLGLLLLASGRPRDSFDYFLEEINLARDVRDKYREQAALGNAARAAAEANRPDAAIVLASEALATGRSVADRAGAMISLRILLENFMKVRDVKGALATAFILQRLARELGHADSEQMSTDALRLLRGGFLDEIKANVEKDLDLALVGAVEGAEGRLRATGVTAYEPFKEAVAEGTGRENSEDEPE